jgi:hypothetical protein
MSILADFRTRMARTHCRHACTRGPCLAASRCNGLDRWPLSRGGDDRGSWRRSGGEACGKRVGKRLRLFASSVVQPMTPRREPRQRFGFFSGYRRAIPTYTNTAINTVIHTMEKIVHRRKARSNRSHPALIRSSVASMRSSLSPTGSRRASSATTRPCDSSHRVSYRSHGVSS